MPRFLVKTIAASTLILAAALMSGSLHAQDVEHARQLYQQRCAVCHGADRGGYIGPALNSESLARFTEGALVAKTETGGAATLMPPHPAYMDRLAGREIEEIAWFIKNHPLDQAKWAMDDIAASLETLIADEALPTKPSYAIEEMDDLMAVTARGREAMGNESKVVFFDGRTNDPVGEIATLAAPHIVEFHPTEERWAYVTTDTGYLFKIDLYSLQAVRRVRVGLNGISVAVSRDGRYLAAGSYIPNTAVILDAKTLEPLKLFELRGEDPDGKMVESDAGVIIATPYANVFLMALEQSGQVWVVDLDKEDMPVTRIANVGRHLHDAFLSPTGRYVAVSSYDDNVVAVIDLEERRVVKKMPAGRQPHLGSGAVVEVDGRMLGIGTNIGTPISGEYRVTIFDMETFEVIKQIPVAGPTESPAAHPKAPYIIVDIVGISPEAAKIQAIDKKSLEVVKTITVGGHSHFPEYTARGDYLYVSAGYGGDALTIYRADDLTKVKSVAMEVPAGIFSHARSHTVAIGLEPMPRP